MTGREYSIVCLSTALSYSCFGVKVGERNQSENGISIFENGAENEYISFTINQNGTIAVTEKQSGKKYIGLNQYEDSGDCGNSYIYKQTVDKKSVYSDNATIKLIENNEIGVIYEIISQIDIPEGLGEKILAVLIWLIILLRHILPYL